MLSDTLDTLQSKSGGCLPLLIYTLLICSRHQNGHYHPKLKFFSNTTHSLLQQSVQGSLHHWKSNLRPRNSMFANNIIYELHLCTGVADIIYFNSI